MFELLLRQTLTRPWMLVAPIFAAVVATGLIVGELLYWSTVQVDLASASREEQVLSAAVTRSAQRIAKDQEASTVWDDAVMHVRTPDPEWLDANLGVWMHTYYGHDRTYVLSGDDKPVYAMEDGDRVPPEHFGSVASAAAPLVRDLRHELATGASPDTPDIQTLGALDLAVIGGHPAIVSVKPIVSDTGKIDQVPGSEAVHISVRYLDGDFITRLSANYRLDNARFSSLDDRHGQEVAFPYTARDGRVVGYLIWSPYLPGSSVRGKIAPALSAALAGITVIIAVLVLALRKEASALEGSEARARHLAEHDTLTDLPNRMLFNERLRTHLAHARNDDTSVALLALDLDRFKQVNDSLGHPAGDELLRQVAARLCGALRGSDTIARIGGDEFSIILPNADDRLTENVCSRLIGVINEVFDVFGHEVSIGLSIGAAITPADADDNDLLIRRADLALYAAKQRGRGRYVRFTKSLEPAGPANEPLATKLKGAISGDPSHERLFGELARSEEGDDEANKNKEEQP